LIVLIVRSLLLAILASPFLGQLPARTEPCLDRTIPVNVYSEKGQPLLGLTAANFKASVKGAPLEVMAAAYGVGPRRIVVLIDTSGSMLPSGPGPGLLKLSLSIASSFVVSAPADDTFALLTFSNSVEDRINFGQDRARVLEELSKLSHGGWKDSRGPRRTAILDAVSAGLALLNPVGKGDAIYLITDGDDNASHVSLSELRRALENNVVRVFCVCMSQPVSSRNRTPEGVGPADLARLVASTGGRFYDFELDSQGSQSYGAEFSTDLREELQFASSGLRSIINENYVIGLRLATPLDKPGKLDLQVVDDSGRRNKHVQLFYPQQLVPCVLR
jgi:hypothetical protein